MTIEDTARTPEDTAVLMPASGLAWVFAGYEALGMDIEADCRAVGLTLSPPFAEAEQVPQAAYAQLLQRALSREAAFAVLAGCHCPFGTFTLLDCTAAACATLRDAIHTLMRYFAVVTRRGSWSFRGSTLELSVNAALPPWLRQASAEFGLHYTARRLDELIGGGAIACIEVPWPAPAWAGHYPYPTVFAAERAGLTFHESALAAPSLRADPLVAEVLARNAALLLRLMPVVPAVQASVNAAILALMPHGLPGMEAVAESLGSTPRTLRRRLAEEGLTFSQVRDGALCALARERMRDPRISLAEVAYELGFSELRAFDRAFRRWTGEAPGKYRRTMSRR